MTHQHGRNLIVGTSFLFMIVVMQSYQLVATHRPNSLGNTQNWWEWIKIPVSESSQIPGEYIEDCDFLANDDGWAVGPSMSIKHWNGQNWSSYQSSGSFSPHLYSVKMLATNNVWVVGSRGTILHWDGQEWDRTHYPTENDLLGVSFSSDNFGFAVSDSKATNHVDRLVIKWDGKAWSPFPFPETRVQEMEEGTLRSIEMISRNDGWLAGSGFLYHWNGSEWGVYTQSSNNFKFINLTDFSLFGSSEIWAVGFLNDRYVILKWNGNVWEEQFHPNGNYMLVSIKMVSPDLGWAVGVLPYHMQSNSSIDSIIYTWNGRQWIETPQKDGIALQTICAYDQEHAWISGIEQNIPITLQLVERQVPTATGTLTATSKPIVTPIMNPTKEATLELTATKSMSGRNSNTSAYFLSLAGLVIFTLIATIAIFLFRRK